MNAFAAPKTEDRPRLLVRLKRLWHRVGACRREAHPGAALIGVLAEYEQRLPAYLLFQTYAAWQAARIPRWQARRARQRLGFSWRALWRGLRPAGRACWPFGRALFTRVSCRHTPRPSRPEIVHFIPRLVVGGSQKIILDLVRELGHAYAMRVLTCAEPHYGRHAGLEVCVCRTPEAIARELNARPPALIHLHYWGPNEGFRAFWAGLERARDVTCPVLENVNTPVPAARHPRVATYVYVSRHARAVQPEAAEPGEVIHPGVDPAQWAPRAQTAPRDFPTIGMVYRLHPDKLDRSSIEVFIEIVRRLPQTRVLIVGEGPLLPRYVARTRERHVRANFHFAGRVRYEELPAYYDRLDLFLAPVHTESYGVVVPYAMCKALPVLGRRVGALPEILGDESLLCANPGEMAERAVALLQDPASARAKGAALRERAGRFSLDAMAKAYDRLYAQWERAPSSAPPPEHA